MTQASALAAEMSRRQVILCADDFGMSAGVSRGILELAEHDRISATSAMVTFDRWPQDARRLTAVRSRIGIGLHINLTLGKPLGPMPSLAPDGEFPTLSAFVGRALAGRLDAGEIGLEVTRQLSCFEAEAGFAPDHVDGHQHVHALPGVRQAVLAALAARFPRGGPLLRDPTDWSSAVRTGGSAGAKALLISALSAGFGAAARAKGFATNTSFAGVSSFDHRRSYAAELDAALRLGGRHHLVMCHPGYPDAASSPADPIALRREDELAAIMQAHELATLLWRPSRAADGPCIAWTPD
jgi:predicted glycoside hydrolase/deacetylase ChbG (UPF0249 family)